MESSEWLETLREQVKERQDPWVVLEGGAMVDAAIAGWWEVPGVLASDESSWEAPVWSGLECVKVSPAEFSEVAGIDAGAGVVGLAKLPQETPEVAKFLAGLDANARVVVCPFVADARAAGEILRDAAAMEADGVLFGREGASPFEREGIEASGGDVFRVMVRIADGGVLLRSLKAAAFELVTLGSGGSAMDVRELGAATGRRALIIGGSEGLGNFWNLACDRKVRVPGSPDPRSANQTLLKVLMER